MRILGEPLRRALRASRRAIRSITFAAASRLLGGSATIPLACAPEVRLRLRREYRASRSYQVFDNKNNGFKFIFYFAVFVAAG
jgi:hypothetical protein